MNIKVWKDKNGYAFQFESAKFELTHVAMDRLLHQLLYLEADPLEDADSIMHEIELDLPEEE